MSEDKRFEMEFDMNITDNFTDKEYNLHTDDAFEFIELINKQNKENNELKKSNDYLQNQLEDYVTVEADNIEIREENERLKFENETLKSNYQREIQSSIDFCNTYSKTNGELLEEIDQLKQTIDGLEEEKETLQQIIWNLSRQILELKCRVDWE